MSSGVNVRAAGPIVLGAAEYLAGDGGDLADPKEQELKQVHDGVALSPLEVDVGGHAGAVADVEQKRGQRVGTDAPVTVRTRYCPCSTSPWTSMRLSKSE